MANVNEKYHKLLEEKTNIENELNEISKNSVVCAKCGYCKRYEDIDIKRLFAHTYPSYDDSGTDFYYKCNECNTRRETGLTREQFMGILKTHNLTYEEWKKKYPKNRKYKFYY